jgi:hypothetical protein
MKTKIYTLLFLLISTSVFQANSQTAILNPVNKLEQKVAHIKAFESKYFEGKVYLHITVNNNIETKIVTIERSLDAIHFEAIGNIIIYGTTVHNDLGYHLTDELPVVANLYYRLADYTSCCEPAYSETISVFPIDDNKIQSNKNTIGFISTNE